MQKGLLIILSGPSGVGKGTVREYLMEDNSLNLVYSVSCTTRSPRGNEKDKVDYFFLTKDEFLEGIKNGKFLEYASYCDNYYGTPKDFVEKLRNENKNVIVEIETSGAKQLIDKLNGEDEISIFILPPNFEELEKRIRGRNSECEGAIKERLIKAHEEIKLASLYDFQVINKTPIQCANEIRNIVRNKLLKNR